MPRSEPNKIKLNDLTLKNLKPREGRPYLVWDLRQHGLCVQIQPSGNKAWKCIYPFHGRPRWFHLGRVDAIGLADARKLAGKIMVQVGEGKDPQADRKAMRSGGTFEELAKSYVEQYAKRKNKSWKQADALVRKHLIPKWGKLKAANITRSDVKAMMSKIEAPIVANQMLASASALFSWAIREEFGGVKVNPCHGIERNDTKSRERVLSNSEIPLFWKEFNEADYLRGRALMMILLTGQRPGEVIHMRTEHIEAGWWTLPGAPVPALGWLGTKNAESHRVWLPAPAQKILTEMETTGLVFAGSRGKPIDKLEVVMKAICKSREDRCKSRRQATTIDPEGDRTRGRASTRVIRRSYWRSEGTSAPRPDQRRDIHAIKRDGEHRGRDHRSQRTSQRRPHRRSVGGGSCCCR